MRAWRNPDIWKLPDWRLLTTAPAGQRGGQRTGGKMTTGDEVTGDPVQSASEQCEQRVQWVGGFKRERRRDFREEYRQLFSGLLLYGEEGVEVERIYFRMGEAAAPLHATRKTVMGRN